LAWGTNHGVVFGGQVKEGLAQFDVKAPGLDRKVVLMGFSGGKKADGVRKADVASTAVSRPVHSGDDEDEVGGVMEMACDAETRGINDLLDSDCRGFELGHNAARVPGIQR
jgi:hypothetical protein